MSRPWRFVAALARPMAWPFAAAAALQSATIACGIGLMGVSAWLIATAGLHPSIAVLGVAIVGVRFFGIARGLLRYLERLASHGATLSLLSRLRVTIYRALAPRSPSGLLDERSGDLVTRLVDDVETLDAVCVRIVGPSAAAALVAALVVAVLAPRGLALAGAAVAGLAVAGVLAPALARRLGARAGARSVALRADVAARAVDAVQGIGDLLAFGRGEAFRADLEGRTRDLGRAQARTARVAAAASALVALAGDAAALAVLALAVPLVRAGVLDGVQLPVAMLVTLAAFEAAPPLAAAWAHLGATRAAAARIESLVGGAPAVGEPASPLPAPAGRTVDVRGLTYRHPAAGRDALREVSLSLRPGRLVAVVGPSGAGKTTLAGVLLRFHDAPPGTVLLDGRDVRDYRADDVRGCFAYADQRASILTGTIRENLLLGAAPSADGAPPGSDGLAGAVELAGLGGLVRRLPDGLDTWIGEQGQRLSGGERQRLALARAALRAAPFLILDEPGAHLDPAALRRADEALRLLARDRGVLLVTHRTIGLEGASEIVVLHEGAVIQRGTFSELRRQDGWFRRMHELQRAAAAIEEPAAQAR
ncbi:MAG TPA: thiol reductant ABC exporter subunit CydC [Vicinamibacterales bacterium]|nr:thiol reductant ABC exporter subunit CydC [Vicinamibacterales bacterium]